MVNVRHIAIILDGNRRYARNKGIMPWEGHEKGANKLQDLLKWCNELNIKVLTLYTFSMENFSRPKKEVDYLMNLFRKYFRKIKDDNKIMEKGIRINVIGRIAKFPKDIRDSIRYIMKKTEKNNRFVINFAMGYGGRQEIVDATRKIAKKVEEGTIKRRNINEKVVGENMYMADEPDIVIRPGGEIRISNFLLWQSSYSEWFFVKKLWPEFSKRDIEKVIKEFGKRTRRFGA